MSNKAIEKLRNGNAEQPTITDETNNPVPNEEETIQHVMKALEDNPQIASLKGIAKHSNQAIEYSGLNVSEPIKKVSDLITQEIINYEAKNGKVSDHVMLTEELVPKIINKLLNGNGEKKESNYMKDLEEGIKKEAEFLKEFEKQEIEKRENLDSLFSGKLTTDKKEAIQDYLNDLFSKNETYDIEVLLKEKNEEIGIYKELLEEARYFAQKKGPDPKDYKRIYSFADKVKKGINSLEIREGQLLHILDNLGNDFAECIFKKEFFRESGIGCFKRMHEIYNYERNNKWDDFHHSNQTAEAVVERTKEALNGSIQKILELLETRPEGSEIVIYDIPCGSAEYTNKLYAGFYIIFR